MSEREASFPASLCVDPREAWNLRVFLQGGPEGRGSQCPRSTGWQPSTSSFSYSSCESGSQSPRLGVRSFGIVRAETEPFPCSPCLYCQELCRPRPGACGIDEDRCHLLSQGFRPSGAQEPPPESAAQAGSRQTNCGVLEGAWILELPLCCRVATAGT